MSAPKWTPAQRAAIEDRGGTLLVSAAAGSGKTAVLVERAVRLITDAAHPVAADRLLIVTFTRAAAEELRGRIAVRLAAEAAAHPESAYLRRQRLLLGRANICTIDAFCMQLLKRYFAELGLPPELVERQPFPGPGLSVRILGEVTERRLATLRRADAIFREEVERLERRPEQYFAVLTGAVSVGVRGDSRSTGEVLALRAVTTEDFMTADWSRLPYELVAAASARITAELPEISRVVLDVTPKPPATVEWE